MIIILRSSANDGPLWPCFLCVILRNGDDEQILIARVPYSIFLQGVLENFFFLFSLKSNAFSLEYYLHVDLFGLISPG